MFSRMRNEKGFTLIELMVVVLIIAILIAIAVPVFNVARSNAQRRTCQANLRTLDGAIQTYKASEDVWPNAVASLVDDYIKAAPRCPTTNSAYTFTVADPPTISCPNGHTYP